MKISDAINQVGNLMRLPAFDLSTIQMAANYFCVSSSKIKAYYYGYITKEEGFKKIHLYLRDFVESGYEIVETDVKTVKRLCYEDFQIDIGHVGVACLSDETIVQIAYKLKGNPTAQKLIELIESEDKELTVREYNEQMSKKGCENIQVQIFSNPEFGSIRMVEIDGEPWFVGKDIAEVLGYTNAPKAIRDHVDDEEKLTERFVLSGQYREAILINESGLYSLILSSKLPSAKKFKRWVTTEVLPSIRKHGTYMTPETLEAAILNPDVMIRILQSLKNEREKNKALVTELEVERTKSSNLILTNHAMSLEINQWEERSVLNALMRSFAIRRFNGSFKAAFDVFYKQFKYKYHVDVRLRKSKDTQKNRRLIDYIREEEMGNAVRLAVAICESSGIDTGRVINEVNAYKYSVGTV